MDKVYFLAVDIGASSGRHILSHLENGKMVLEEVYRFKNGFENKKGHLCWNTESLFNHILNGMKKCAEISKIPSYMGIDTWGVDFVLLDDGDKIIGDAVSYRDSRTNKMDEEVYKTIPESELYEKTGIQKMSFNTVYQLMWIKKNRPKYFEKAKSFLMIPDYLNFLLTGVKHQEYTIASTSQLVNVNTNKWDTEIIEKLGYKADLFKELHMPGEPVGKIKDSVAKEVGYTLTVMHVASHDTGSAVLAMPTNSDNSVYLNSGTWSLMGIESLTPLNTEKAHLCNFTNEGGYAYRYRFLKNIMGLWMIQSVKKECNDKYSFDDIANMAKKFASVPYEIDVNNSEFLIPESMSEAVRKVSGCPDLSIGEVVACIYNGLAKYYAKTVKEIADVTGKKPCALHIIGGGSKDTYLNELAAKMCDIPTYAGPTEATAIGNITAQLLGTNNFTSIEEARECIFKSFEVRKIN